MSVCILDQNDVAAGKVYHVSDIFYEFLG